MQGKNGVEMTFQKDSPGYSKADLMLKSENNQLENNSLIKIIVVGDRQ